MKLKYITTLVLFSAVAIETPALTNGAHTAANGVYENRTCNQLYMEVTRLEPDTHYYDYDLYNEKNSHIAGYILTVFSPAIYYFGYTAYREVTDQYRISRVSRQVHTLRTRMAELHCFEK